MKKTGENAQKSWEYVEVIFLLFSETENLYNSDHLWLVYSVIQWATQQQGTAGTAPPRSASASPCTTEAWCATLHIPPHRWHLGGLARHAHHTVLLLRLKHVNTAVNADTTWMKL